MFINSEEPVPSGSGANANEFEDPTNAQNSEINDTNQPMTTLVVRVIRHEEYPKYYEPTIEFPKCNPDMVNKK